VTCYVSANIAAPCQQGHAQDGQVHCVSTGFFCAIHCPIHGAQATLDWKEPARTIAGEQDSMF